MSRQLSPRYGIDYASIDADLMRSPTANGSTPEHGKGLLFVSTVSELAGGAEHSLLEFACALAARGWRPALAVWQPGPLADAFRSHGFEVSVRDAQGRQPGSPLGGATRRFPALEPIARLGFACSFALRPIRREVTWLRDVITAGGFELVHSNCDLSIPVASRAARQAGTPFVAHVRDHWRYWFHPRIERHLRRADAVLVTSHDMARRLRSHGLASRVVQNPVAGDRLARGLQPGERDRWRAELGVGDGFAVAMVGRLDGQKRVELALRALHAVPVRTPVTLVVAGQGSPSYEKQLRTLWRALRDPEPRGRKHQALWLGHRTDVAEWLPALDALIMPSRGEPFGRAIVEGMLAGLPVVTTTDGAGAELIEDGRTGLLVAPDEVMALSEAMRKLAEAPELRHELGLAARAEAQKRFSPAASAATVETLYRQLWRDSGR